MKTCGVCQAPKIRTDCSRTSRENAIFARPWRARRGQRGPERAIDENHEAQNMYEYFFDGEGKGR
jgi:hypothetical protein